MSPNRTRIPFLGIGFSRIMEFVLTLAGTIFHRRTCAAFGLLILLICLGGAPATQPEVFATADEAYANTLKMWSGGNQSGAEGKLRALIGRFPNDPRFVFFYAACTRSRFDDEAAAPFFMRTTTLSHLGRFDEADVYFEKATLKSPKTAYVWKNWKWSMRLRGDEAGEKRIQAMLEELKQADKK